MLFEPLPYFDLVCYLRTKGYSERLIAKTLQIQRQTVRRYLELAELPDWQR